MTLSTFTKGRKVNKKIIVLLVATVVMTAGFAIYFLYLRVDMRGGKPESVTIKGSFLSADYAESSGLKYNTPFERIFSQVYASDASQVSKVVALYCDGRYVVSSVSNSRFSIDVEKVSSVGLIFLKENNDYVGYLTLGDGLDTLPLNKLAPGVTTIDLQTLSFNDSAFVPSHNPIGSEILLTPEEKIIVAQSDDFFASVVKNPDVDYNGEVDFLKGEFFAMQVLYYISGGDFGDSLTPAYNTPADITGYKLCFEARDTDRPSTVFFNGPEDSHLNVPSDQSNVYADSTTYFSLLIGGVPALPPDGQYTVTYKTRTFYFNIPDQSSAPSRVVLVVPTVTLNSNGTIQKVNWTYRHGGESSAVVDPEAIFSTIQLQISGTGKRYADYPQSDLMYESGKLSASTTEHTLPCQDLEWSDVTVITMAYNDIYDNHYVVVWTKMHL